MAQNQEKSAEKSSLPILLAMLFFVISLVFFLPQFLNNSGLKLQITQKINKVYAANLAINGKVKIALLPYPAIIAEDVLLQNLKIKSADQKSETIYNLHAKEIQVRFPIFDFSNRGGLKEIIFSDAIFESFDATKQPALRENDLTKIIDEIVKNPPAQEEKGSNEIGEKIFAAMNIDPSRIVLSQVPSFTLKNSEVIYYDYLGRKKELKEINAKLKMSAEKISANGSFSREGVVSDLKLNLNHSGKSDSTMEITSPVLSLRMEGKFSAKKSEILDGKFKGKISAEIIDLKSFYKTYISSESVFFKKLRDGSNPIKAVADVEMQSKIIDVNNLSINSNLLNGTGDINLDLSEQIPLIDITLQLLDLDLDGVWLDEEVQVSAPKVVEEKVQVAAEVEAVENQEPQKKIEPINFEAAQKIKDFDLNADIKVKSVKYLGGEIKDVDLYLTVSNQGEVLVQPLVFRMPGEGALRLTGVLDGSTEIPKFVGKIDVKGQKLLEVLKWMGIENQNLKLNNMQQYSLYSDILLLPNSSTFNNIYANLGEGKSEFLGEVRVDNSGKSSAVSGKFSISDLRVEDFFASSKDNSYLSSGSLLKKLFWLNDISADNKITLNFGKISYKDEEFFDQSLNLKFGRGYLEMTGLNLKSDKTEIKGDVSIDISDKNPKFELTLISNKFHYKSDQIAELKDSEASDENSIINARKSENKNIFDQFFALPSLEGFNGNVSLSFKNSNIDDVEINNFELTGALTEGNITNTKFACDVYGGNVSFKGLLGLKVSKAISGNLALNNIALQPFLNDLVGINQVVGVANISASITASSDKKSSFADQISAEIKFNANAPTVMEYGLNDLVRKMFASQIYRQELQHPEEILFNSQATTVFKQASGNIQINNGKEGRVRINLSAPAVNSILSGTILSGNRGVNLLSNTVFLTGNRQKQTPINIATNIKGQFGNLSQSTNMDQVLQYLGLPVMNKEEAPENDAPQETQSSQ